MSIVPSATNKISGSTRLSSTRIEPSRSEMNLFADIAFLMLRSQRERIADSNHAEHDRGEWHACRYADYRRVIECPRGALRDGNGSGGPVRDQRLIADGRANLSIDRKILRIR